MSGTAERVEVSCEQNLESLNRARDFFGDPFKRWVNRLTCENRSSYIENYICGRAALVLQFDFLSVGSRNGNSTRFISDVIGRSDHLPILILKANAKKPHKLQNWNDHLMLIQDVQLVQSPQGEIPSLVGFNCVQNEVGNRSSDLLLFQSTLDEICFQSFPRIGNWKPSPVGWLPAACQNNFVVEMVKGAPEIMKGVTDDKGARFKVEGSKVHIDAQRLCSLFRVFFDADGVKVSLGKVAEHQVKLKDVFFGPFNLEP